MLEIAGFSLFLISLLGALVFFYKYSLANQNLSFLQSRFEEVRSDNEKINQQKFSDAEIISALKSKVAFLEQQHSEYKKNQDDAFSAARTSLFNLGSDLSNQLIELHKKENLEARKLSEEQIEKTASKFNSEFEKIIESVSKLDGKVQESKDTIDLVKQSLLSPSGAGALAEITLENILKSSGLRAGVDYFLQYHLVGSKSERLRPDALIFLPNNNFMIIDAKASKFLLENDAESLQRSMLSHLKDLSSKDYHENVLEHFQKKGIKYNNIVTLMFLPTEHAIEKISDITGGFMQKAWDASIFPVGPAGLVNMLSLAKFQIADNLRNENYKLILDEVRKLINATSTIAEYSKKMGSNLQNMVSNYDKFAASFNRNFMTRARTLNNLGVESIKVKNLEQSLDRYQLVSSKSEILEIELLPEEEDQEVS